MTPGITTTSLDAMVARGRAVRRRRRSLQRLGAAVAAAGIVLAGTGIWRGSGHPQAALAPWTVSKLRFNGQNPPACLEDLTGTPSDYGKIFPFMNHASSTVAFTIDPSALPAAAGVWIEITPETHNVSGTT